MSRRYHHKNPKRVKQYLKNFEKVEQKWECVGKRFNKIFSITYQRNEIMDICEIDEGPTVGRIKKTIEEAIINGDIENNHQEALDFLMEIKKVIIKN